MRITLITVPALVASIVGLPASAAFSAPTAAAPAYGVTWTADGAANSLSAYAPGASGSASAVVTISGQHTGLHDPSAVAVGGGGKLYVANAGNDSITEYTASASGDASPIATIAGPKTGLDAPSSLALAGGEAWVTDPASNVVEGFSTDTTGNALPAETISGHKTLLEHPVALAVSDNDLLPGIVVVNAPTTGNASILGFFSGRRGDAAPDTVTTGTKKHPLKTPSAVMPEGFASYWIADSGTDSASLVDLFSGLPGLHAHRTVTGLDDPTALGHDALGHLVVANAGDHSVRVYAAKANGHATPIRTLTGVGTDAGSPSGAAVFGTPPAAPTGLRVHLRKHSATMSWHAPHVTGGGIIGYQVEVFREQQISIPGLGGLIEELFSGSIGNGITTTHTTFTKHNIKPGRRYGFEVVAVNGFGSSPHSNVVHKAHVRPPSAPLKVSAFAKPHTVLVQWQPPAQDGGASITDYRIQYAAGCAPGASGCKTHSQDAGRFSELARIGHLKSHTAYQVRVLARNKSGLGSPSKVAKVSTTA